MVRDGEGKKHSVFFPKGKSFVNGWSLLVEKLRKVAVNEMQEKGKRPTYHLEYNPVGYSRTGL